MLKTSTETVAELAQRAKSMRLAQNLTQAGLEQRSGVSLGSIKLFERTGKISFESLVKIAIALGASEGFDGLFQPNLTENRSIDDLLKDAKASTGRKRGRVR
jgi:transcriptional regulator with XRE-family HTH domain